MPIQAWPGGRHGDRLHRWFQMTHISIGGIESPPCGKLYDCVDLDLGLPVGPNEVVDAETHASEVRKIAQVGGRSRSTVSSSSTHKYAQGSSSAGLSGTIQRNAHTTAGMGRGYVCQLY